jgi:hypothetical protein
MLIALAACSKEKKVVFGVVPEVVYEDKALKTKKKSDAEYISILYTNLYQVPISPNQLYKIERLLPNWF